MPVDRNFIRQMWLWEDDEIRLGNGDSKIYTYEEYFENMSNMFSSPNQVVAVYLDDKQIYIGYFILEKIDFRNGNVFLHSCMGDKNYRKTIYVYKGFKEGIKYCFRLGLRNIIFSVVESNLPAIRLLKKFKAALVGRFDKYYIINGERGEKQDLLFYQIGL